MFIDCEIAFVASSRPREKLPWISGCKILLTLRNVQSARGKIHGGRLKSRDKTVTTEETSHIDNL